MANWFVIRASGEAGPFTSQQLKQMAAEKRIGPDDQIRREDQTTPTKAGTVRGLFPANGVTKPTGHPQNRQEAKAASLFARYGVLGIVAVGVLGIVGSCMLGTVVVALNPEFAEQAKRRAQERQEQAADAEPVFDDVQEKPTKKPVRKKPPFSEEDVYALHIVGKSQQEMVDILGKPRFVFPSGRLVDGNTYEESWKYEKAIRHPVTGHLRALKIFFDGGQVVGWDVQ